uniref:BTB domain-containing protein n=1 Tax=Chromera velia CCMP2878 TaxID=1169474 RepID=A0A0G4IBI9_9ALVE|eukprot:Cvel_2165.t1-p1 / transcript=Cvel_2165.t1 / gene=Cvel_2165 / organism=Chromera_velia_CCMP2878 / gene_product=hypothetical protein / transcript_product=hypothetical protein / location=Cvel_scaffold84:17218-19353(+) / protein_length=508 / sequence_SO=supercontig / SO=protein_coding / is_pseudo=false
MLVDSSWDIFEKLLEEDPMSVSPSLQSSALCSLPSPVRELRLLDEDSVLYCMEGDRDVYELRVSELKESSQESPGKLFCKVPYLGIPLLVGGGRAGRLVVVVPTDKNEKAEEIEEWVVAIDCFSQITIPAPVKGPWSAATVCGERVYLLDKREQGFRVFPKGAVVSESSLFPSRPVEGGRATFGIRESVRWDNPMDLNTYFTNHLMVAGTDNRLFCCTAPGGIRGGIRHALPSGGRIVLKSLRRDHVDELGVSTVAAVSCGEGFDTLVLGTEGGAIYRSDSKNKWKSELLLSSVVETKITAVAFLPNGSLLFSQGTQLMLTDQLPGVPPLSSAALPKLAPAVSVMRKVVFEGAEGADVELLAKADSQVPQTADVAMLGDRGGSEEESARGRISIPDTTTEALKCVVLYLHTDMVELRDSCAVEVSALGRFLGLSWLQEQAEKYAQRCISLSNCASLLVSAERRSFPELRKRCIDFAAKNIKKVVDAPEFQKLSSETMYEIFQALKNFS